MKNILKQAENAERLLKLTSDTMLLLNRDGICMDIAVHNVNLWFMKEEKLLGKNLFQLIPPSTYYQVYTRVRDKKSFRKVPIALISLRVPAVLPAYCQRNNRL